MGVDKHERSVGLHQQTAHLGAEKQLAYNLESQHEPCRGKYKEDHWNQDGRRGGRPAKPTIQVRNPETSRTNMRGEKGGQMQNRKTADCGKSKS